MADAADLNAQWFAAMRRGEFATAWRVSDQILAERAAGAQSAHLPRHEQWVWDGRPLANRRVLVRCYHGLGDTLQFARFLTPLQRVARTTIVWAQPPLLDILRTLPGNHQLLPLHDGTPNVEYEVDVEIMELAHALRVTPETLAESVPYFDVPAEPRPSGKFSVGVLAEAGDWDPRRSIPVELIAALNRDRRLDVFNLQLQPPLPGMRDLSTPDIRLLASRLRALDLVITPDTMLAHLAGALAIPTWTLLPLDADWRWMQPDRSDSPWYPTMRLFRQPRPDSWQPVIHAVLDAVESLISARSAPPSLCRVV